jgi:hypothetical protein
MLLPERLRMQERLPRHRLRLHRKALSAMQTITEALTDIARGTRAAIIEEIQDGAGLNAEETAELAKEVVWTGCTRQHEGTTFLEFIIPGTWNGRGYSALVGGRLLNVEPEDNETAK